MCSIIGSFSKDKFKELVILNQKRGLFSYSFLVLDPETLLTVSLTQGFGGFDISEIDKAPNNMFYLGHTQAPTGGLIKDYSRIHPAQIDNMFLFHNGIIKQKDVKRLQQKYMTNNGWDSMLMLEDINSNTLIHTLNTIDGSFACVFNDTETFSIFRSAAGTLFIDDYLNISSVFFNGSERIKKDTIYTVKFKEKLILESETFKSKSNPYFY